MAGDITFGIRLTADASGFTGTVKGAADQLENLGRSGNTAATELHKMDVEATSLTAKAVALGSAVGTLAGQYIGQAIHSMVEWATSTIHAAAALSDLSTATGSSVAAISEISNSFKISGVSSDQLGLALQRLSVGITGVDDESGRAGKALALLGVQSRDPATALQELADKLAGYADGANKAAIVQDILGRGAQVLLPALKDLAEQHRVGATVTAQQAQEAENLEKSWRQLSTEGSVLKDMLLSQIVPAILEAITQFKQARAAGLGFFASIGAAGIEAKNIGPTVDGLAKKAEDLAAKIKWMQDNRSSPWFDADQLRVFQKNLDDVNAKLQLYRQFQTNAINAGVLALGNTDAMNLDATLTRTLPEVGKLAKNAKAEVDGFAQALRSAERIATDAEIGFNDFGKAIDEKTTPAMKRLAELQDDPRFKAFTPAQRAQITAALEQADAWQRGTAQLQLQKNALEIYVSVLRDGLSLDQEVADVVAKRDTAQGNAILSMQKLSDQIAFETTLVGRSNVETETAIALRQLEASGLDKDSAAYANLSAEITRNIAARNTAREADKASKDAARVYADEWRKALDTVMQLGERFFVDLGTKGQNAFKNLWENFKRLALQALGEIAAKQVVVSIVGAATGAGSVASAAAQGLGNSSGIGSLGNLISPASSAYNFLSGGTSGLIANALTSEAFSGVASSLGLVTEAGATIAAASAEIGAGTAAVGASLTTLGATFAAAVPVVGLFVAAAILAYEYFSAAKGGPKQGGAYSDVPGSNLYPGETNATNNAQIQSFVSGIGQSYQAYFNALGGKGPTDARFGLGYDTDPNGTAQSRVSGSASVGGRTVFNQLDQNAGRDDASLQAGLTQEAARAVLAALQATDLPQIVHDYLETIDAGKATLDQINTALQHAQELEHVSEGLADLKLPGLDITSLAAFARGTETIGQTFDRVSGAYNTFVNSFTTPTEKLKTETDLVNDTFAALGVSVPESVTAYRELVQSIDLSTDAGRQMFSTLITISPAFLDLQNVTTDATGAIVDNTAAQKLYTDKLDLQAQIYELTGDAAGAAAVKQEQHRLAIEALDPSLRDLQQNLYELQDAAQAAAEATASAAAYAQLESDGLALRGQIAALTGNQDEQAAVQAAQHAIALAALDPALRQLQQNLWDLQDAAAAAARASSDESAAQATLAATQAAAAQSAAAYQQLENQGLALRAQIAALTGDQDERDAVLAAQRAAALEAADPALRDLTQQLWALQDAASASAAAAATAAAYQKLDNEGLALRAQIAQLTGDKDEQGAVLAAQRAAALAATDPALRDLTQRLWDLQDAAAAAAARAEQLKALNAINTIARGNPLEEALASISTQWDKLTAQGNQLDTLTAYFDGTADATTQLSQATQQYHQSLVQVIATIEQLKTSAAALFTSNIRDFTLDGLDKQGQYGYLQSEVNQAMEELKSATDPARINALAQLIASDQKQAYGLLDPDQKNAVRQQFIEGAQAANALIQQRLQASEDAAEARNEELVQRIGDAIEEALAASAMRDAAAAMQTAADTMQGAADTPKEVDIHVDVTDDRVSATGTY